MIGKDIIRDALSAVIPEDDRIAAMMDHADQMKIGFETLKGHCYGRAAPEFDILLKYFEHFGPRFIDAVLKPTGYRVASAEEVAKLDSIRENVEAIENAAKGIRSVVNGGRS